MPSSSLLVRFARILIYHPYLRKLFRASGLRREQFACAGLTSFATDIHSIYRLGGYGCSRYYALIQYWWGLPA